MVCVFRTCIENRCFPVVSLIFFAPAALETLSTHSISFRSNKQKSNITVQNSGRSPAGVKNHLNLGIQLIRRHRRNFFPSFENTHFLIENTIFATFWDVSGVEIIEKMSTNFGLRPISQISPPCFRGFQNKGGVFGKSAGGRFFFNIFSNDFDSRNVSERCKNSGFQ